ncbi:ADP-heptose:LPS heptosyltransferase II [bacterium BMS3Bbin14]|nr:ADP-heptose:LPS heptosyltransferase II [bacterium BMS3Abin13]GBE53565.1 ADP-heptose:LPS heptosyltransferase II [bacterium BMS3Bbin14]HDK43370.1 glycosyltransferase family 9 protein [Desulfobacteraceae bacterium]
MNVDLMRTIDRRVGVPLAFLLTLARRTAGLLRRPAPQMPKKILFVELSEMGSTILADPAMRKAKEKFAADLYFVIFQKNRASLDLIGTIDPARTFTIREDSLLNLTVDTVRFLFWVRRQRIDTVIDLELFSRFTALLTGLSGAVNRVGFYNFYNEGLYRGELLSHRVAYNPHIHIAKNFIALVNSLIAAEQEVPYSKQPVADEEIRLPVIHYDERELQGMRERVRRRYPEYDRDKNRLVLINPNASELLPQRRWLPERYLELIQRILQAAPDILVLITGAPAETMEAAAMCEKIGRERCINFAGALKLGELPLLYSIAEFMVTNDSGPGHFSAITPLPTFVLFGPETPKLYGSLGNSTPIYAKLACSPCVSAANHRKTPCRDNKCLQAITVEAVMNVIRPFLRRRVMGKEQGKT